jgi:hypothetical protein
VVGRGFFCPEMMFTPKKHIVTFKKISLLVESVLMTLSVLVDV